MSPFSGVQVSVTCNSPEVYLYPVTLTITGPAGIIVVDSGVSSLASTGVPITGAVNLQLDGNTGLFNSYPLASPTTGGPSGAGTYPIITWLGAVGPGQHQLSIEVSVDPLATCGSTETATIDGTLQAMVVY